jgi:TRAP transporter TAXI family solute receptor
MLKWVSAGLIALLTVASGHAAARLQYNIVTGSENGTYLRVGNDLVTHVAPQAGMELLALPSKGSVENIKRLRDEPGTKLALIQADVYQAYKDLATKGNAEASRIIKRQRVVLPMYNEEIYMVVRADSPLRSIGEIRDQRINIGSIGSGTAMTAMTLYRMIFDQPIPDDKISTLSNEEALIALVKEKTIDVVIVVAGQPATLFLGMEPGVEKYFRLLKLDDTPNTTVALGTYPYTTSTIRASSYPAWLTEDQPTFAVQTLLVTYKHGLAQTRDDLVRFAKSLCENFPALQSEGHPKWREVSLSLPPPGPGWSYYTPTFAQLERCTSPAPAIAPPAPVKRQRSKCGLQIEVLGLCPGT